MKYTTKRTKETKKQIAIKEEDLIFLKKWGLDNHNFNISEIIRELIITVKKQEVFFKGL